MVNKKAGNENEDKVVGKFYFRINRGQALAILKQIDEENKDSESMYYKFDGCLVRAVQTKHQKKISKGEEQQIQIQL